MTTTSQSPILFQEEFEAIESKRLREEYCPDFLSEHELIKIFSPKEVIEENINIRNMDIIEANSGYQKSLVRLMSIPEMVIDRDKAELAAFIEWTAFFEPIVERSEDHLKRLNRMMDLMKETKKDQSKDITEEDIARAKQIPISSFIQFNQAGFARCLWHSDKNPSMKFYKKENRCWCFSCNQGGDVIDVIKQIREVDFIQAVKHLLNR